MKGVGKSVSSVKSKIDTSLSFSEVIENNAKDHLKWQIKRSIVIRERPLNARESSVDAPSGLGSFGAFLQHINMRLVSLLFFSSFLSLLFPESYIKRRNFSYRREK